VRPPAHCPVVIVGAGPAGLVLARILGLHGIESVVLERRSHDHVLARARAGIVEQPVADLLDELGAGDRLRREGLVHEGVSFRFGERTCRIDFAETVGRHVVVYSQQDIVADLLDLHAAVGTPVVFGAEVTSIDDFEDGPPRVRVLVDGHEAVIGCDLVVCADGTHGVSETALQGRRALLRRIYRRSWLGVLVDAAPAADELLYSRHRDGFALMSMRGAHRTRLYLEVPASTCLDDWSDDRIWTELHRRLDGDGLVLNEGDVLERGLTPLASSIDQRMRYGRLLLVGDAAHVVPPTGAKGLNCAIGDAVVAARAIREFRCRGEEALATYTSMASARIWGAQRFSWQMTTMFHQVDTDPYERELRLRQLEHVTSSAEAMADLARQYTGLDLADRWDA